MEQAPQNDVEIGLFKSNQADRSSMIRFFEGKYNKANLSDPLYFIDLRKDRALTEKSEIAQIVVTAEPVVAGSSAMEFMTKYFGFERKWKPNDIDLFFFDSLIDGRFQLGKVDLISSQKKTVIELLDSFDLPCCRVAYNSSFLCFTEQAACALFFGIYAASDILGREKSFKDALCHIDNPEDEETLWQRTRTRLEKYATRGYRWHGISSAIGTPSFLANREAFNEYSLDAANMETPPSLAFGMGRYVFDQESFVHHLRQSHCSQVMTLSFLPEFRDRLLMLLAPDYKKLDHAFEEHGRTLRSLKEKLEKPLNPTQELEFRIEMLEAINQLEKLQLTWKLINQTSP